MYDCSTVMKLIHAHLDGELDVKESMRVETHFQECAFCRENFLAEKEFLDLLHQNSAAPPAPEFAARCVKTALDREVRRRVRTRRSWKIPLMAAAVGLVAAIAGFVAMQGSTPRIPELVRVAVHEHHAYLQNPASLDVTSADGSEVSAWLSGRLQFEVGIPPDSVPAIQLVGGSVVDESSTRAAHLAYRAGGDAVSLLMTPPQEIRLDGRDVISFRNILFHSAEVAGYHTLEWSDSRHTYVLVSSSPRAVYQACLICHGSERGRHLVSGFANHTNGI